MGEPCGIGAGGRMGTVCNCIGGVGVSASAGSGSVGAYAGTPCGCDGAAHSAMCGSPGSSIVGACACDTETAGRADWLLPPVPFVLEIVLSLGCCGGELWRPVEVSHGSGVSPNMSRMKRPSAIVDSDMRADTANCSSASSRRPALW